MPSILIPNSWRNDDIWGSLHHVRWSWKNQNLCTAQKHRPVSAIGSVWNAGSRSILILSYQKSESKVPLKLTFKATSFSNIFWSRQFTAFSLRLVHTLCSDQIFARMGVMTPIGVSFIGLNTYWYFAQYNLQCMSNFFFPEPSRPGF